MYKLSMITFAVVILLSGVSFGMWYSVQSDLYDHGMMDGE